MRSILALRPAEKEDRLCLDARPAEIDALLREAFSLPDDWSWEPHPDTVAVVSVRRGGACVACLSLLKGGWLHQVAVSPEHRGQGLGRGLVGATLTLFGLPAALVQVDDSSLPGAREFWRALGFRPVKHKEEE